MADTIDSKTVEEKTKQLEALTKIQKEASESIEKFLERALAASSALSVEGQKYSNELRDQLRLAQEAAENRKDEIADLENQKKSAKTRNEQLKIDLELEKLKLQQLKDQKGITDEEINKQKRRIEGLREELKLENERKNTLDKIKEKVDLITGGFSKQVMELFSVDGVLKSVGMQFQAILKGNSEFAAATGQVADRISGFGAGLADFGIGFEKLNKASIDLFMSMSNFSNLNKQMQADLATSAAKMNNLGISVATTGKNYDLLTKSLRVSTEQAKAINEDIAKAAIGAGIAPKKMAEEFASSMSSLAAYGKQGVNVYIDLQKQAKSLGMELGTLNSIIGDQFDTFEGAARAAGKFNAVLGGNYLNSVEMLNATESERILLLKQSFDASGKNFDSLSKYEKKAVAATLGIKDLNEASKLFSSSTAELTNDMNKQAATNEQLEKSQKAAADTMEKLTNIFNGFLKIISPVVDMVNSLINILAGFPTWANLAIVAVFTLIGGFGKLSAAFSFFGDKLSGFGAKIGKFLGFTKTASDSAEAAEASVKKSGGGLASSIRKIGSAATKSAKGLLALGASALMIGAGIAAAALGFAQLVAAFKDLSGEQVVGAVLAISAVMIGFGFILSKLTGISIAAVIPLQGVALAFFGIGAGIAIAAVGIAFLVDKIVLLLNSVSPEKMSGMFMLSASILALAASFYVIGASSLFAVAAIVVITGAIFAIGKAFSSINTENIKAFSGTLENFLNLLKFEALGDRFGVLTSGIKSIGAALNELPENKTIALQTLNETLNTAKTITEDNIKPTKEFISVAKEYYQVQATSKEADKDTLVAALKEIKSAMAPKEAKATTEAMPVKLVISGTDLATALKSGNTTVNALLHGLTGF